MQERMTSMRFGMLLLAHVIKHHKSNIQALRIAALLLHKSIEEAEIFLRIDAGTVVSINHKHQVRELAEKAKLYSNLVKKAREHIRIEIRKQNERR